MSDTDHLFLHARSWNHENTAGEFLASARDYLVALAELEPDLESVVTVTNSPAVQPVVRPVDPAFVEAVLQLLYNRKDVYFNLAPGREMTTETRAKRGFSLMVYSGRWRKDATVVELRGHGSVVPTYSDVHVTFEPEGEPARRSPEFAEKVLRLTIQQWRPLAADLTSSWFDNAIPGTDAMRVGWLTYLTDPRVPSILPSGAQYERFADGILIRLDGETFDRNPEQIAQAIGIRDALAAAGLLNMPPAPKGPASPPKAD